MNSRRKLTSPRTIGVHLRLQTSYSDLAKEALSLGLDSFQLFLMPQNKKNYLKITTKEAAEFKELCKALTSVYVHSSYWINLATGKKESAEIAERLLKKELTIAEKLGITNLVLHPGSAKSHPKTTDDPTGKKAGISSLATILNKICAQHPNMTILLENTAHESSSIGSDFNDFIELKKLFTNPEQIKFCLDFAHAYAYGYDVTQTASFIKMIKKTIGIDSIKLIHLNDSTECLGSKKDHHEIPGKGLIGTEALKALVTSSELKNIPVVLELPPMENSEIKSIIDEVKNW